jgi:filamentous hemagglutinin family protein
MAPIHVNLRPVAVLLLSSVLVGLLHSPSGAQTTSITPTVGTGNLGTIVTPAGTIHTITGGKRPGGGANLFHSFGQFSIGEFDTANFFNETGLSTTNILSRVTGTNPSNIFGTIQTTGFPGAHLFLMNPNGVVFGATAQLNVEGSFHVTTADYLRLTDGARFTAEPGPQDALLSSAPVAAFGFLNNNAAAIAIQGSSLSVADGQAISLVGGNRQFMTDTGDTVPSGVTLTGGTLTAPSGQIKMASVASSGELLFPSLENAPNINGQSFGVMGSINLSQGTLDVSDVSGIGAGSIMIRGGQFTLDASTLQAVTGDVDGANPGISIKTDSVSLTNGTQIVVATAGLGRTGDIQIASGVIDLSGSSSIQTFAGVGDGVRTGDGGDIVLNTQTLTVREGSFLNSVAPDLGSGGNIIIEGSQGAGQPAGSVTVSGQGSLVTSETNVAASGGQLSISAQNVVLEDSASLATNTTSVGKGGDIVVNASTFRLSSGATILSRTDSTDPSSSAGTVTIQGLGGDGTKANLVTISGSDSQGPSGISSDSSGDAIPGEIKINTKTFSLADGGVVKSGFFDQHRGGNVTVMADTINMSNGSSISSAAFDTAAGRLHLSAPTINVDASFIQANATATGRGGDIVMEAGNLNLANGARVDSSTSGEGDGGTVTIRGLGGAGTRAAVVTISGPGTGLFTDTQLSGAGGSISVQSGVVAVNDGGRISAESHGLATTARGGVINIEAGQMHLTGGGEITAKSFGPANAGSVQIILDDSLESGDSRITTEALLADGGDIHINAGRLIHLTNSQVTSTVGSVDVTTTVGGNIFIDPQFVILDNSSIRANAFAGTGGNINIVAGVFLVDPLSIIDASSALGVSGTITIQSPISDLSGTLAPLPAGFLRATPLLSSRCVARLGGPASSFVVAGRDAIPMEPGGLLPSPLHSFDTSASANSHEKPPTSNVRLGAEGLIALNLVGLDGAADCAP